MNRFLTICLVFFVATAGLPGAVVGSTLAAPAGPTASAASAGVAGPEAGSTAAGPVAHSAPPSAVDRGATDRSLPQEEPVGCVDGICHDDRINVDQSDGLSDKEMEAYVSRAMARVEHIRGEKFAKDVPVEVMTREQYRERLAEGESDEEYNAWNDQVWEALFIVGENESSEAAISGTLGGAVAGFYSPKEQAIVVITENSDQPVIDNVTLIHELTHALQDQRHDLAAERFSGETQDGDLAVNGIVEGEAVYVEQRYSERCGSEWECVETPQQGSSGRSGDLNVGILVTVLQPYSDGPGYVHDIVESEGWEGVDRRMENPPVSSTQVIHRTDREPTPIEFEDEARGGWETFPDQGVDGGADTVGEASIFSMFWYQSRPDTFDANAIDPNLLFEEDHPYERYNYVSEPSAGWANDKVYPYRNAEGDETRYGYVWLTEWQTKADAEEFRAAYARMLDAHNVRETDEGYLVVDEGPFRGAYLVVKQGTRVTIVHGPTVEDAQKIRPSLQPDADDETPTAGGNDGGNDGGTTADGTATEGETDDGIPGFGAVVALVALAAIALLARRN